MKTFKDCTVSQPATGESYKIIDDHCPDQFVNTQREGRWHDGFFETWDNDANKDLIDIVLFVDDLRVKCRFHFLIQFINRSLDSITSRTQTRIGCL